MKTRQNKAPSPIPKGHRSRLRQRFQAAGPKGLHDYEALELLLTFALPRIDTKPIARALLDRFGGMWGVFGSSEHDLQQVSGVGPRAALLISLMREIATACFREGLIRRNLLNSPDAVADYARMALAGRPNELCLALFVNTRNELIGDLTVSEGTIDRASVFPRRVIELAVQRRASGLILVHNHPSGDATPSPEDDRLTRDLKAAAAVVDLRFLDHVIVATHGTYSYKREAAL